METSKVYSALVLGTFTQIKSFRKENAIKRFKEMDPSIRICDIKVVNNVNSHQAAIENLYPDKYKIMNI